MNAPAPPPVSKGPDCAKVRADRVRLVIMLYRKQGMSAEEFRDYWQKQHSKIFAGLAIVKKNLLKYQQVCHPSPESLVFD